MKIKRVLHVDGEYLRNSLNEFSSLKGTLEKILREVGHPTHLVYYDAKNVSNSVINVEVISND